MDGKPSSMKRLPELLRDLGVKSNDVMLVEAPADDLGSYADFDRLAEVLYDAIAPAGTLVVPTCTAQEGSPKPTFDPILSPSEVGPFSEFFRQRPSVVRSHSPTHSVAAFGPSAGKIVSGHRTALGRPTPWGDGPFGYGSPWDILCDLNACWAMIDASWHSSPFTTYVQSLYADSHSGITKETPFPRFNAACLDQVLDQAGILRCGEWNRHRIAVFRVRPALQAALEVMEREPNLLGPDHEWRAWLSEVDAIKRRGYLHAGAVKVKITPATPCSRWDGKQLADVYRDLYARILVLSRGPDSLALVVCDLIGLSKDLVDQIRDSVSQRTALLRESIMVVCTHAHSTPDTVGAGLGDPQYLEGLVETVAKGVCQAAQRMQPARLGWGTVPIRGLAHSRRIKMIDDKVFTTRYGVPSTWRVRPELIASQGVIDPDLTVVRIEALDGEVLAVVTNFGCHASVALMSPNVSGDYPGEAMHVLETALAGSAVALCTIGTAADVDPTLEMPYWGPRDDANARRLGRIFAAQVLEHLERIKVSDEALIECAREQVELPVRTDWVHLVQMERERLSQEFVSFADDDRTINRLLIERVVRTEVQAMRLNDLVLVGFPGEVFTSTGLKLKERVQPTKVSVLELTNDYIGYILTPEAAQEGGYETGPHLFTRVDPEAEEIFLSAAARLAESLSVK